MGRAPSAKAATKRLSVALVAALLLLIAVSGIALAQDAIVQTYYIPVDEDDALVSMRTIHQGTVPNGRPLAQVWSYVSIAVGVDNTVLYYDQWENNFDLNPATDNVYSAGNPGGTQIWGNNNCADGYPPNRDGQIPITTCVNGTDVLQGGNVIVLRNGIGVAGETSITLADRQAIDFDGGDKVLATEQIAITRLYWPDNAETLEAVAIEVPATNRWGTGYTSPVGQDPILASMFNVSALSVQAMRDGTTVAVDADGAGAGAAVVYTLDEGQSEYIPGIMAGATVVVTNPTPDDYPVQVVLLAGNRFDASREYQYSGYTLAPDSQWGQSYWSPVSGEFLTTDGQVNTQITAFNRSGSTIYVRCEGTTPIGAAAETISIANGSYGGWEMLPNSGARCYSVGNPDGTGTPAPTANFFAIVTVDSAILGSNLGGRGWDWGISMVADDLMDTQSLVGLGLGRDPEDLVNSLTQNGSPIWVTAESDSWIYIDANGDGCMDPQTVIGGDADTAIENSEYVEVRSYTTPCNSAAPTHAGGVSLPRLSSLRVYNMVQRTATGPMQYHQTGMQLFSRNSSTFGTSRPGGDIVTAWGEDPTRASVADPGFDVGTTVFNVRGFSVAKSYQIEGGDSIVLPGDTVTYTIRLRNTGASPLTNLRFYDPLDTVHLNNPSTVTFTRYNSSGVQMGVPHAITGANVTDFLNAAVGYSLDSSVVFDGAPAPDLVALGGREYVDAVFVVTVKDRGSETACDSSISNTATVTVDDNKSDTATIYTPCKGQLTIIKKVIGPSQTFTFDPSSNLNGNVNFDLTPATNATDKRDFINLPINRTYAVTETIPAGWSLTGVGCVSSLPGSSFSGTTDSRRISGTLRDLESVTCTFTNTVQYGSLTVAKVTAAVPTDVTLPASFQICISGPTGNLMPNMPQCQNVASGASYTFTNLWPGAYTVTEPGLGAEWAMQVTGDTTVLANETNPGTATVTNTYLPGLLTVTKTFVGTYDVDYTWDVTKTVNSPLNLFVGNTGVFTWTIDVVKSAPIYSGTPRWQIAITNGSASAVTLDVEDSLAGLVCPNQPPSVGNVIPGYVVAAGATVNCVLTGTVFSGASALPAIPLNTVTVEATAGYTATASVQGAWGPAPATTNNNTVDVVDSNGQSWSNVSSDASFPVSYPESVGCFSNTVTWHNDWNAQTGVGSGERNNHVEVRTQGANPSALAADDAQGIVNCYEIVVTPSCVADAPILSWVLSGPDAASKSLTLEWMSVAGGSATVLPGGSISGLAASGQRIWLGANTSDGNIGSTGVQWPGWTQNPDGSWNFTPNSVNPNGFVRFSFNPTSGIKTVAYPPSSPTCSTGPRAIVGDRVWFDKDADGVQESGENGAANVFVEIYQQGTATPFASTSTNANGIYTFTVVGGFNYSVKFYPPYGYIFTGRDQGADNAVDSDANPADGTTTSFSVPAGGIDPTWDAGLIGPAIIVDKVTTGNDPSGVAHTGDGITIDYAKNVTWTYVITNPGPTSLMITDLFDDKLADSAAQITCANFNLDTDVLAVGASITCTATGVADQVGYSNIITVTAEVPDSSIEVEDSDPSSYLCVGNELKGLWYYENNGVAGYQAQGDFLFSNAPDSLVPPELKNIELPAFLSETGVPEMQGAFMQGSFQGSFQFSDLNTAKTYTLRLGDDSLIPFGYAGVSSSLRFNVAPQNCTTLYYEFGYAKDGAAVGDLVWYDTNRNGLQDEWFDANNDGVITQNNSEGATVDENGYISFPLSEFEFIDLNGNGLPDLEGELNKCGLRSVGPTLELLDANGNLLDTTIAGNTGRYRFRSYGDNDTPLSPTSVYSVRMPDIDNNPGLLSGVLEMVSTGLCKVTPAAAADAAATAAQYAAAGDLPVQSAGAVDPLVCRSTTDGVMTRDLSRFPGGIALTYDFGIQCQPSSTIEDSSSLGDFVWQDTNKNGVQDVGEVGVSNVKLQLFAAAPGNDTQAAGAGTLIAETTTNAAGNYLFAGLDAGTYYIQMVLPNGVVVSPRDQGVNDGADSDIDGTGKTSNILLPADKQDLSWDMGIYSAPTNDPESPEPDLTGLDKKQYLPVIGGGF